MRIIVLFNLRPGVDPAVYEAWARTRDIPAVRGLASVDRFDVVAATGMPSPDAKPPYEYFELIEVNDMDQFGKDAATQTMQAIIAEFQTFANNPAFVFTRDVTA